MSNQNMRRSISLSPIRTESGANLRTANWTRLKFKNPNQNRNFNNRGGYHNYNYNRGGFNPNYRFQRGRGFYQNRNNRNMYVPKKRNYSSNRYEHSRSRSYSRSRSKERSHSRGRYSYSKSRSRSHSRSASREKVELKENKSPVAEQPAKTESETFYRTLEPATKEVLDFPEKVGTNFGRWDSPNISLLQNTSDLADNSLSKKDKYSEPDRDPEEIKTKMTKSALESVARHEKSLQKIMKAQSGKWENESASSAEEEEVKSVKKEKKAKKKKAKSKKNAKKAHKMKPVKDSDDSSNTESSEEASSSDSSHSSPVRKKSKNAKKKKRAKLQSNKAEAGVPVQQTTAYPFQQQAAYPQAAISQAPPTMMMAPNMPGGNMGDMQVIGPYGQPMNVIRFEMAGPDGQMMQFVQIPSMPQQTNQQPPVAQPIPTPQPVPPPSSNKTVPAHAKIVPTQEKADEPVTSHSNDQDKELTEKQKRRKEVIRTRLWPRPVSAKWSAGEEKGQNEKDSNDATQKPSKEWPLKLKDESMESNTIPGFDYADQEGENEDNSKGIPGLSPDHMQFEGRKFPSEGQKIPTLSGRVSSSTPLEKKQSEGKSAIPSSQLDNSATQAPMTTAANLQPVAYPQIVQGFTPVYSGMQAVSSSQQDVAAEHQQQQQRAMEPAKRQESKWTAAAEEFINSHERPQQSSSDGEYSSSSDEYSKSSKRRKQKKKSRSSMSIARDDHDDEDSKKYKKKKKNKKERKDSVASDVSPIKDKKRKKKKKNKEREHDDLSETDSKRGKKSEKSNIADESDDAKMRPKDDLERHVPQDLPLSHIRGLVVRRPGEGSSSIFSHISFDKAKKSGKKSEMNYEDQFVSLFQEEAAEKEEEENESPLTMSRKALKKIKIKPQGTRSVTHMTKISLCERISTKPQTSKEAEKSQKVSVNLASLSNISEKFGKNYSPSPSRSRSRSNSTGKSASRSRSRKRKKSHSESRPKRSPSRSASRSRSRSASRSNKSRSRSLSRSRSRSRSMSLPKAYSMDSERPREDERHVYRRDGNRFPYQQNFRYNPRFQRGRGNYNNYRGRGFYYNNNRGYNNRGGYNRGRGYYNNNNYRDRTQPQNWKPHYRSRNENDRRERSHERRSRSHSHDRHRESSYSSDRSEKFDARQKIDKAEHEKFKDTQDEVNQFENKPIMKQRQKSPVQWTHDKYEEQDSENE